MPDVSNNRINWIKIIRKSRYCQHKTLAANRNNVSTIDAV